MKWCTTCNRACGEEEYDNNGYLCCTRCGKVLSHKYIVEPSFVVDAAAQATEIDTLEELGVADAEYDDNGYLCCTCTGCREDTDESCTEMKWCSTCCKEAESDDDSSSCCTRCGEVLDQHNSHYEPSFVKNATGQDFDDKGSSRCHNGYLVNESNDMSAFSQKISDLKLTKLNEKGEQIDVTQWALEIMKNKAPELLDLFAYSEVFDSSGGGVAKMSL